MRKQGFLFAGMTLLLISLVSAYSYNPASIGQFFDALGGDNLSFLAITILVFALATFLFNKSGFFGENKGIPAIIALVFALGAGYGIYKSGMSWNLAGLFYNLGFSDTALDVLVFFLTIGIILFLLFKFGINSLLLISIFLLSMIFMGIVNDPGILTIVGIVMLVIWIVAKVIKLWKFNYQRKARGKIKIEDVTRR